MAISDSIYLKCFFSSPQFSGISRLIVTYLVPSVFFSGYTPIIMSTKMFQRDEKTS